MKLLGNKLVEVGGKSYPIRITNRAMIEYEHLSGESIASFKSTENIIMFFYCTAKAGAKYNKVEFNYTYDEFLDLVDDYYTEVITNFTKALNEESGGAEKKHQVKK